MRANHFSRGGESGQSEDRRTATNPLTRQTIARINRALLTGRSDNIASTIPRIEVDTAGRGEIVTTAGMPALFVGQFRTASAANWTRWTSHDDRAFPSLCAAFDAFIGGKAVAE